jgi:hypothetical protein
VLLRSGVLGAIIGAVIGGVVGTPGFPLVGTAIVAVAGSAVGAVIGGINGVVLIAVGRLTTSSWALRLACTLTTLLCCLVLEPLVIAVLAALLAGALGLVAAHGAQPVDLGRRLGPRQPAIVVGTALAASAVIGAGIGAAVGLVLGLTSYPPTSPFAAFEGALFGLVLGAFVALVGLAVFIGPRLRACH